MEHTDLLEIYNDVFCLYSSEKNESTIESFERFLEKGILKMVYSILKKISSPSEKNSSFAFSVNYYSDNFKGERFSIKIEDKEIKTFVFKDDLKLFISNNLFENFVAEDDKINVLNTFYQDYSSKITFSLKDYFAEDNNKCIKLISFEQNNKKKKIEVTIYKNNCESSKQEDNIQFILNDISTFINNFSINGKTEDKYYKPYFDYLTNNLKDQKLNQYAFSFVNKITGKNLGNLVITTCNKIKLKKLILIHFIVEYILSRIAETDNNLSLKNANIKSAIAAIMSRNMSHNLGSHVFYYTRQNILDIYETEKDDSSFKYTKEIKGLSWFLHYVQERQDFVANINSGDSYIFGPLNLKQDVIDEIAPDALDERHLDGNKANKITKNYLLENIVRSEKISRHSSENKSLADIQIEIKFNGKKFSTEKDTKVENEFYNLDFAVQGGQQSRHAFLIMLENIIRNSAKHAFNKSESNNLTITIDVERLNNGYKISIYDNTKNADVALDTLKWSLESLKYIDENTNTIDRNNKGLKEILVSVLWLKGLEFGKIEEYAKDPEILNIENIEGNIAFTFTVPVFENEKSLSIEHISKILNNESLDIYATIFNVNEIIIKQYIEKYLKFNISKPDKDIPTIKNVKDNLKRRIPRLVIINSNTSKISFWETIYRNSYQLNDNRQNLLFDRSSSDSNNIKISLIESEKVKELENTKVYFNNHLAKNKVTLKNAMNKIEFNRGLIYENISGANQAFNLMQKFTRTLNNANTDSLYWNVMMNYDTKIIIIDERLAYSQESKNLESDIKLYDSGEMELGEIFEKSGLHFEFGEFENNIKNSNDILKKLDSRYKLEKDKSKLKYILPNQSKYFIYNNIPKISQNIYEKFKFQQKTFPFNLEIDDFKLINSLNDTYNPFLGFLEKENMFYQIDFLTIHIGLIDKIKEKEKSKTTKEIVNSIIKTNKLNPKYVCVHSGRGGLNDENDKINFVPFSILQRCFEDSKFLLSEFFYNNQYLPI